MCPAWQTLLLVGDTKTVCWYLDDPKIFHRDKIIVNEFMIALANEVGSKSYHLKD
jgi:hypothetical protein